jgi:PQQ-dependent catabolism-associated CXXCW motif protein
MTGTLFRYLAFLPLASLATNAFSEDALSRLQSELVSAWVVTVGDEARPRSLRILGVGQKGPDTFLLDATFGWVDGEAIPVRGEVSQASSEQKLQIVTSGGTVIAATRVADGSFAGTFTPKGGAAKPVKIQRVSEQAIQLESLAARTERENQTFANEDKDWGVSPTSTPRKSQYHAPTPRAVPGGRVVKTMELRNLLDRDKAVVVIDVLDSKERTTVPGALWMPGAGSGEFYAVEKRKFADALVKLTGGDLNRPLVFLCLSSECWLSYNAALHAIDAGHKNVMWYRGGTDSWGSAGLPRRKPEQVAW